MPSKLSRLYWDACCFIALFESQPSVPQHQLAALKSTFRDMLDGKVKIVTSDAYYIEVFKDPEGEQAMRIKVELENCPNFEPLLISTNVSQLAGRLRKACIDADQSIEGLDAQHVAAGQLSRCDEIWTTDKNLVKKFAKGLLGTTPIVFPHVTQYRLEFEP